MATKVSGEQLVSVFIQKADSSPADSFLRVLGSGHCPTFRTQRKERKKKLRKRYFVSSGKRYGGRDADIQTWKELFSILEYLYIYIVNIRVCTEDQLSQKKKIEI